MKYLSDRNDLKYIILDLSKYTKNIAVCTIEDCRSLKDINWVRINYCDEHSKKNMHTYVNKKCLFDSLEDALEYLEKEF
jgi:hypothetical protein